jgi:hypothetical protein
MAHQPRVSRLMTASTVATMRSIAADVGGSAGKGKTTEIGGQ